MRMKARGLQRTDSFKSTQHTYGSVVSARIWNCINMRARSNRRKTGVFADPAGKRVTRRVVAQFETRLAAQVFDEVTAAHVCFRVDDPCDHGRLRLGDL